MTQLSPLWGTVCLDLGCQGTGATPFCPAVLLGKVRVTLSDTDGKGPRGAEPRPLAHSPADLQVTAAQPTPTSRPQWARGSPLSGSRVPRPRGVVKPLTLRGDSLCSNGPRVSPCTMGSWWGRGDRAAGSHHRGLGEGHCSSRRPTGGQRVLPACAGVQPRRPRDNAHLRGSRGARMF